VAASRDLEVSGVEQFIALSRALRRTNPELRKQMNKQLREAVKPLIPMTRQAALQRLPRRGGLAALVARVPQRVQVRSGGRDPGVRLVVPVRTGSGARAANRGVIRRRTFGREPWVDQPVTAGWFDDTVSQNGPRVARPAVEAALAATLQAIVDDAQRTLTSGSTSGSDGAGGGVGG
jgi:hypothetical protein